jgi:anti-sigma-K factor RskA
MSEPGPGDRLGLDDAHPDVAGWVLGALDPDDAEQFAEHLDTCPACKEAVRAFQPVRGLLEVAAPPVEPPPGLRARTLRAVELAAARDVRRRRVGRWLAAAAAVVVLLAGAGIGALLRTSAPAVSIALTAPAGGSGGGRAVGHDTPAGWSVQLSVHGLPPIPEGQGHYECWYVLPDDGPGHPDKVSAGSFEVAPDGSATDVQMWTVVDLKNEPGTRMVVTKEPDDDPALTGPVVLSGPVHESGG